MMIIVITLSFATMFIRDFVIPSFSTLFSVLLRTFYTITSPIKTYIPAIILKKMYSLKKNTPLLILMQIIIKK